MVTVIKTSSGLAGSRRDPGFVRHELHLALALALVAAALVLPRLVRGQFRGALLALLGLAAVVAAGIGLLLLASWIGQLWAAAPGSRRGRAAAALGHLARFGLCGFIGMVIATALAANHRLGAAGEKLAAGIAGPLAGTSGVLLHLRLGRDRFWRGFRRFALALLGSLAAGILGILLPEPWGIDLGVLAPLLLFLVLALV